jgi:hypothetical protein
VRRISTAGDDRSRQLHFDFIVWGDEGAMKADPAVHAAEGVVVPFRRLELEDRVAVPHLHRVLVVRTSR